MIEMYRSVFFPWTPASNYNTLQGCNWSMTPRAMISTCVYGSYDNVWRCRYVINMKQHSWISFFVSRKQFWTSALTTQFPLAKNLKHPSLQFTNNCLFSKKGKSSSFSQYDTRNSTNEVLNESISRAASQWFGRVWGGPVVVSKSCLVDDRVFLSKSLIEGETTLSKTRWMFLQLKLLNIFLRR